MVHVGAHRFPGGNRVALAERGQDLDVLVERDAPQIDASRCANSTLKPERAHTEQKTGQDLVAGSLRNLPMKFEVEFGEGGGVSQ